jgi:hypothetical protein
MLKRKSLFIFAVVLVLGFVSCDTEPKDTYYIAICIISESTYMGINTNWATPDVVSYASRQSGTTLFYSQDGYSLNEVKSFLRDASFMESDINYHGNRLTQRGSTWEAYATLGGSYALFYAYRE